MIIELAKSVAFLLSLCLVQGFILRYWRNGEAIGQAMSGIAFGGICVIGMSTPIEVAPGVIFDARSVILSASGLFGGPLVGGIAAIMAGAYRVWLGGDGAPVGVAVVISCVALGLLYRYLYSRGWVDIGIFQLLGFGLLVHLVEIYLFTYLPVEVVAQVMQNVALPLVLIFTPATAMLGLLLMSVEHQIRTEQSLSESKTELEEALNNLQLAKDSGQIGTWIVELATGEVKWDANNIILHGLPEDRMSGTFSDWAKTVHPDDLERVSEEYQAALEGIAEFDTEYRVIPAVGEMRHLKANAMVVRNYAGKAIRVVGMNYDLTKLRRNEAELLQTQKIASQAQKMEGIGQLTGGIAHDFNNLLTVIVGNLELLQDVEKLGTNPADRDRQVLISSATAAANRGGELTKKMLAFARQSSLEPVELNINSVVQETKGWLSRTIPSNIEIGTKLQSGCWLASLDIVSLQSAIVNVVLNARDAMPEGGKLTIETSNVSVEKSHADETEEIVPPGRYVMLAVTDTGEGIPPSDLDRVFDPFFTTKEVGFGTGLGLSMVQGFVKQSEGFVRIHSEVGTGTSVKLYFPAASVDTNAPTSPAFKAATKSEGTSEARLLLVDDQAEILDVLQRSLSSKGYTVEIALSGQQALEQYRTTGPYDLLITDLVMPGKLSGPELAKTLRELNSSLPVIYMSGYASVAVLNGDCLHEKDIRLMKPVSRAELLRAVEQSLSGK